MLRYAQNLGGLLALPKSLKLVRKNLLMEHNILQVSNVDEHDEPDEPKAVVNPHPSPYDQAKTEVEKFKGLCSGTLAVWQNFEKPFRCKISRNEGSFPSEPDRHLLRPRCILENHSKLNLGGKLLPYRRDGTR